MKLRILYFVPAFVWMVLIYVLLVMPSKDIPSAHFFDIVYFDKWVHAGLFGMQVLLTCWPFLKTRYASPKLFVQITIAVIAYGVAMEFVQKYFTGGDRDFDIWDMAADTVGAVIAWFVVKAWFKMALKKQQKIA